MTDKLYYSDSYINKFSAKVISCMKKGEIYEVVLNRTAFFPNGGGQSADTGKIGDIEVTDVKVRDGVIIHKTVGPLLELNTYECEIYFNERFSKMQQHTGEHIVSGLINSTFGYNNVGFHLGKDIVTMDFDGVVTKEQLRDIELCANEAVVKNLDVIDSYPPKEELENLKYRSKMEIDGQVRIITISGYDVCACCAPHVKKTGEIGIIKLTNVQNYKGGVRISMLCGFRALTDYNIKESNTKEISVALSAKEEKILEAVERQKEEISALKSQIIELNSQLLKYKAADIEGGQDKVCIFDRSLDSTSARELVNIILSKNVKICAVFFGDGEEYRYVIGSKTEDVREMSKKLNELFNGKGGGKPEMVQGSLRGQESKIRSAVM